MYDVQTILLVFQEIPAFADCCIKQHFQGIRSFLRRGMLQRAMLIEMALREQAAAVSCQSRSLVCSQAPPCRETGRARHSYPEHLSARTSIAGIAQFVNSCLLSEKKKMDMAGEAPMIATAMEFMARASSTSEVLTLNLTKNTITLTLPRPMTLPNAIIR